MAIPNPNPNIEDGKKCDNKTYSSNKIESLFAAATELPTPEAGDAGKVLTVNAAEDGYELKTPVAPTSIIDDTAAAADTVYSSSKVESLIPNVPQMVALTASDVFTDTSNITSFDAYRYGDLLIVNRCVIQNLTGASGLTTIVGLKDEYKPANAIRIMADDTVNATPVRMFLESSGLDVNGTYSFTTLMLYAFCVKI